MNTNQPDEQPPERLQLSPGQRSALLVRSIVGLGLAALLIFGVPILLAWWLVGGPFGWRHVLIGGAISLVLLVSGGLLFGWAIGRLQRGPQRRQRD